jgi:hypothetical protein
MTPCKSIATIVFVSANCCFLSPGNRLSLPERSTYSWPTATTMTAAVPTSRQGRRAINADQHAEYL